MYMPDEVLESLLVAAIESPTFLTCSAQESSVSQKGQMARGGSGGDPKLLPDEISAHAVLDEITIYLRRKIRHGIFEPLQNGETCLAGEYFENAHIHRALYFVILHIN